MRFLVTGGNGMIGSNLKEYINQEENKRDVDEWFFPTSKELNLLDFNNVNNYFNDVKPDFVMHFSANVGGLFKNLKYKTEMFHDNIIMNENILYYCNKYNVQNGIFCCSTCIFPNEPKKYPMTEDVMMDGRPHDSNKSYAYAKRFLYFQCQNYNEQYNRKYICITPCNLYGKFDNFNLEDSHVISGLIHRFYNADKKNEKLIIKTGLNSVRQFIYAGDMVKIILLFVKDFETITSKLDNIILSNIEVKITDIVELISKKFPNVNYEIENKEEGQVKKTCSNELFKSLYQDFTFTNVDVGINNMIDWFLMNYDSNIMRK
jgi:GDP-L-fucose synthase